MVSFINQVSSAITSQITNSTDKKVDNTKEEELFKTGKDSPSTKTFSLGESASIKIVPAPLNRKIQNYNNYKLDIKTNDGKNFKLNFYLPSNTQNPQVEVAQEKLLDILSNLPPNVYDDLKKECRTIILTNSMKTNDGEEASGVAVGGLDTMYLSVELMSKRSLERSSETVIHELGHLIDGYHQKGHSKEFTDEQEAKFKTLLANLENFPELNENCYSFKKASETFADYYMFKKLKGNLTPDHRANVFHTLEQYSNDVRKLPENELITKYGEQVENVKKLAMAYFELTNTYDENIYDMDNYTVWGRHRTSTRDSMSLEEIFSKNKQADK